MPRGLSILVSLSKNAMAARLATPFPASPNRQANVRYLEPFVRSAIVIYHLAIVRPEDALASWS